MFDLNGKVALITGGAKGIGFSFAKELLANGLKAVSLVDIDVSSGEQAVEFLQKQFPENRAIFIKTDVADEIQFEEAFETTVKTFKQLDIVINSAGLSQEIQWRKCVAINLIATMTGSFLAMEKYLPKYKSADEAVLINMASLLGIQPVEPLPAYSAAKHGIIGFSRSIGGPVHYQQYKVRVLTVCPGATNTSMLFLKEEQQNEPYRSMMNNFLHNLYIQTTEDVSKHLIPILQEGASGSVWTIIKGIRSQCEFTTMEE